MGFWLHAHIYLFNSRCLSKKFIIVSQWRVNTILFNMLTILWPAPYEISIIVKINVMSFLHWLFPKLMSRIRARTVPFSFLWNPSPGNSVLIILVKKGHVFSNYPFNFLLFRKLDRCGYRGDIVYNINTCCLKCPKGMFQI